MALKLESCYCDVDKALSMARFSVREETLSFLSSEIKLKENVKDPTYCCLYDNFYSTKRNNIELETASYFILENVSENNTTNIETSSISFIYNEFIKQTQSEANIFSNYISILKYSSSEKALVYLYSSLIDLLYDSYRCEKFIDSINKDLLSVDAIVHILNALSPNKKNICNWRKFVSIASTKLIELEGEDSAYDLLGVIL